MKASIKEIRVWYKFKPSLSVWISRVKGKSKLSMLPDESWYGGKWFNSGYFVFIQLRFIAIHIIFKWWKIKLK